MAFLVDTNVLVYRFDPREPRKRTIATGILRKGVAEDEVRLSHQAIVEFVSAVTRPIRFGAALLSQDDARREAEELLSQFVVLYPDDALVRTALRGMGAYRLSWYDAHMWAYAETNGLEQIISEDFQHGRLYGSVLAVNPFLAGGE